MKILLAMLSSDPLNRYQPNRNNPYPLGLGYIHSALEMNGHDVKTIILSNVEYSESDAKFLDVFNTFVPDVVGFSIFSSNRVSTFKMIEYLSSIEKPPHIIIGGIHASIMYEQIVNKYRKVVAVIGEGDYTTINLVRAFELNIPLSTVKGIAYFKDNKVELTEEQELIQNLDTIPIPKHDIFFDDPTRTTGFIFTARGCPSRCIFCCLKLISKGKYRKKSVNNVMDEIKYLKNTYPRIKHIQILDDTFLLDNERVIELCKLIIKENMGLTFGCIARVKPISSEMFSWMKKAGFVSLEFGLESGSKKILGSIKKGIALEDVTKLIETIKPFDFKKVVILVMCGFPGETEDTIKESTLFIRSLQEMNYVTVSAVNILTVYPGTEVYETMKRAGRINDDYWLTESSIPEYTVDHTHKELIEYKNYMDNRLAIVNVATPLGFLHQMLRIPNPTIKYLLDNKIIMMESVERSLNLYFPYFHRIIRTIFNKLQKKIMKL